MQPQIKTLSKKIFIGKRSRMSFINHNPFALWQSFMPRKNEIKHIIGTALYSMEVYDSPDYFQHFNPANEFYKWAAVEVSNTNEIPNEMETISAEGLYAVFIHKGQASMAEKTYRFIFTEWLPASDYFLDDRPHIAIMGEKYKKDDPASEEEIWIPIKSKHSRA